MQCSRTRRIIFCFLSRAPCSLFFRFYRFYCSLGRLMLLLLPREKSSMAFGYDRKGLKYALCDFPSFILSLSLPLSLSLFLSMCLGVLSSCGQIFRGSWRNALKLYRVFYRV